MADDKSKLYLLFQKPLEPFFTPKDDGDTVFSSIPVDTDRYGDMINSPTAKRHNRLQLLQTPPSASLAILGCNEFPFGYGFAPKKRVTNSPTGAPEKHIITVEKVPLPDLSFATILERTSEFSLFNETHIGIAGRLTKVFMDADLSSLFTIAAYAREIVNIFLFQYAFAVALQHRPDTSGEIAVPNVVTLFPNHFVVGSAFPKARKQLALFEPNKREIIDIVPVSFTATDRELEQRMAYFREDIAVNSHHWHWHTVYPGFSDPEVSQIVDKDRRGELFYYMHTQMIHRYNNDRMNNDLAVVKPLNNFRIPIPEAYFPKLMQSSKNMPFPSRSANCILSDVHRPNDFSRVEVAELERWRDRIYHAIDQGFVIQKDGTQLSLANDKGINILGNMIEASALSPNHQLYGNLHNQGHNLIAFSHDPEQKFLEGAGVMGEVETAMRDPLFFRWHAFIDDMFKKHKDNLPQYDPKVDFIFDEISVTSVEVQMNSDPEKKNLLKTYWQKSLVVVTNGLDFGGKGDVYVNYTHLQHSPFKYTINVQNDSSVEKFGTCRIFMCPVYDERNIPFKFDAQRKLMVEMDRFKVSLKPGTNEVLRRSDQSSVTTPYDKLFEKLDKASGSTMPDDQNKFCGCGWPLHLLLPKGTTNGAAYNIFVMISNYDRDKVDQSDVLKDCDDASSFCGLKDRKYPDIRPMGFPFDRPYKDSQKKENFGLSDFVQLGKNMQFQKCKIQFCDEVVDEKDGVPECKTID